MQPLDGRDQHGVECCWRTCTCINHILREVTQASTPLSSELLLFNCLVCCVSNHQSSPLALALQVAGLLCQIADSLRSCNQDCVNDCVCWVSAHHIYSLYIYFVWTECRHTIMSTHWAVLAQDTHTTFALVDPNFWEQLACIHGYYSDVPITLCNRVEHAHQHILGTTKAPASFLEGTFI